MPIMWEVEVGEGHDLVQLPTGFAYTEGQTVLLTTEQYEQLDEAAFDNGILIDNGPQVVSVRGTDYDVTASV